MSPDAREMGTDTDDQDAPVKAGLSVGAGMATAVAFREQLTSPNPAAGNGVRPLCTERTVP